MEGNKNQTKIVVGVVVFIVVLTAVVGTLNSRDENLPESVVQASQKLEASYAQSIALGLPVTQEQLFAQLRIPDEDNAALVILPLCEKLEPIPPKEDSYGSLDVTRARTPELLQQLTDSEETLDALVIASQLPGWYIEKDYDQGPFIQFREYAELKKANKLLTAKSIDSALAGQDDDALIEMRAGRKLGEYVSDAPSLIGILVAVRMDWQSMRCAERLAEIWHNKPEQLKRLRDALQDSKFELDPISAFKGEFYMGLATARNLDQFGGLEGMTELAGPEWEMPIEKSALRRDGLPPRKLERAYLHRFLENWNGLFAELAVDPNLFRTSAKYIDDNYGEGTIKNELTDLFIAMTTLVFHQFEKSLRQEETLRDLMDALLKVLVHRSEYDSLPSSLSQVDADLADPFDQGSAVHYNVQGDTVMIWSVGPDGVDNKGEDDDLAVSYPTLD